jgi:hypothetical protein
MSLGLLFVPFVVVLAIHVLFLSVADYVANYGDAIGKR